MAVDDQLQTATLGGGCFWCLEAVYQELAGVVSVTSGYAGGHTESPTYRDVCTGTTGHAEVVQIRFDPDTIDYRGILEVFFSIHDPTTPDRQGHDVGPQYRSIIFYHDDAQRATAAALIDELEREAVFDAPIVTRVEAYSAFYPAEAYHHDYYRQNAEQGYCQAVIAPKLNKFRQRFRQRLSDGD